MSVFKFIKSHKLLVVFLLVIANTCFNFFFYQKDLSAANGLHIFDVPLTEKLVSSLKNCTPYRVKHQDGWFYQLWTNRCGQQEFLHITPQKDGSCRIIKQQGNLFSFGSQTEFDVSIPPELAQKSGYMLDLFLQNEQSKHREIKEFYRCISGCLMLDDEYKQYDIGNLFDAGIHFFTEDLLRYWQNWDIHGKKPYLATPQELEVEEQNCLITKEKLAQLIQNRKFQEKSDFYQAKQIGNLVQTNDFYIFPGGENGKWDMGFMQKHSACYVAAALNGKSQAVFKQIITKEPVVECKCW